MLIVPPPAYARGFYTKAFEWKGIYVLGNNQVPDEAVYRAAEIVFNSIAKDPELAKALAANDTRFAVIPFERPITDLPDYADLPTTFPGTDWSAYRGLGGVIGRPTSSSAEENLLPTHPNDPYNHGESIGLHEWMHAVEGIALEPRYPALHAEFVAAYANRGALWNNTYAATNFYEYFAETAQSFFNDNASGPAGGDGIHNDIDTRAELQAYDPTAYNLLLQIFGNTTWDVGDLFGDAGANTLNGTPYGDLIFGGAGDDHLNGNNGDDRLIGGTQNDTLNGGGGNDMLEGEAGIDTYDGGAGNDTYVLGAESGESIIDGSGIDTITSTINRSLNAGIENLTLTGTAAKGNGNSGLNTIVGNGSANQLFGLGNNDTLEGNGGDDALDGGAGADTMRGGAQNDTYVVDNAGDKAVETAGQGTDLVQASANFTLGAEVENLTLTAGGAVNGTGNGLANIIIGNIAANRINGGAGPDTLTGGAGPDTFRFDASLSAKTVAKDSPNADTITDFSPADDTIELAASVFPKLNVGNLKTKAFGSGSKKPEKDKHLVYYDEKTGELFYDANGKKQKGKGDVLIGTLDKDLHLDTGDILVA